MPDLYKDIPPCPASVFSRRPFINGSNNKGNGRIIDTPLT